MINDQMAFEKCETKTSIIQQTVELSIKLGISRINFTPTNKKDNFQQNVTTASSESSKYLIFKPFVHKYFFKHCKTRNILIERMVESVKISLIRRKEM